MDPLRVEQGRRARLREGRHRQAYRELPRDAAGNPLVTIGPPRSRATAKDLLLEALRVDSGEIETVAHLRGAQEMLPGVEFILDIGGQDA